MCASLARAGNRWRSHVRRPRGLGLLALEGRCVPATYTVVNTLDSGPGSLRQAVLNANAAADADTIDFDAVVFAAPRTILLTSGQISVSRAVTITGPAAKLVLDANLNGRVFNINASSGAVVSLSGLTFTRGSAGAINANSEVTISDCVFTNNSSNLFGSSGAISATRPLTVSHCSFTDNTIPTSGQGGAIYATGPLTVQDSTFSRNSTLRRGGAIYASGPATVTNSKFEENTAQITGGAIWSDDLLTLAGCTFIANSSSEGGAVYATSSLAIDNCAFIDNQRHFPDFSEGGAIYATSALAITRSTLTGNGTDRSFGGAIRANGFASVTDCLFAGNIASQGGGVALSGAGNAFIQNSTFSANTAAVRGGAIFANSGTIGIYNCTIANNSAPTGGGVYTSQATINLDSTIVANNTVQDIAGPVTAYYSLIGTTAGATITGANNQLDVDPMLSPLANFGGATLTYILLAGSPALDAGHEAASLEFDQRGPGFPRTVGGQTDIGATEGVPPAPLAFASVANVTTAGATTQIIAVQFHDDVAINVSSLGTGAIVVTGPAGFVAIPQLVAVDVNVTGPHRTATYSFTPPGGAWDGSDTGTYTVSLAPSQVFDTNVPIPNAAAAGPLDTFNVALPANYVVDTAVDEADGDTSPGHMSLREAIALANTSSPATDTITFDPVVFAAPSAIHLTLGELAIIDAVTIVGPNAALTVDANNLSRVFHIELASMPGLPVLLSRLILAGGTATSTPGGAILNDNAALTLANVTIRNSATRQSGGAIANIYSSGSIIMMDCTLTGNSAQVNGGAVYSQYNSLLSITRTTIVGNTAGRNGGGVDASTGLAFGSNTIVLLESSVISNKAGLSGGGLYFRSVAALRNCTISGNSATDGGGIEPLASLTLHSTTVAFNTATNQGGGIRADDFAPPPLLYSSLVALNSAKLAPDNYYKVVAANSLIGNSSGTSVLGTGNISGVDPLLGPLANNGGPTLTHALLPGSPAIGAGTNPLNLVTDQRGEGFVRLVGSAVDIGAFEYHPTPPPTAVVTIGDGTPQRSMVTGLRIDFSGPVTFPNGLAAALTLTRTGPDGPTGSVPFTFVSSATNVTLSFNDPIFAPTGGSLIDGLYTLTLNAIKIVGAGGPLDGNGDGIAGDDQFTNFHRLFGDADGDRDIDTVDFAAFRLAFGTAASIFDFEADGDIDGSDYQQFRMRFGLDL